MVALSLQDIVFMLKTLNLVKQQRDILAALQFAADKSVSDEFADQLRDLCTERLDVIGFDSNYKPTREGKMLEDLIDKLFVN